MMASLQFTDRAVRSLVKLWSVEEVDVFDDLAEVQARYERKKAAQGEVNPILLEHSGSVGAVDIRVADEFSCQLAENLLVTAYPCELEWRGFTSVEETKGDVEEINYYSVNNGGNFDPLSSYLLSTGFSLD